MSRSRRARWMNAALFVGLAIFQFFFGGSSTLSHWILPAVWLAAAVMLSPVFMRQAGSITHAEAQQLLAESNPGEQPVIVYHRPGCSFCARLKATLLGVRSKARWVDVWEDPEGSAFVKSVNNGNETVPTVIIDGVPQTNPPPRSVRAALTA